ncbi:hypothetical protein MBLNU457_7513t1 [Dothideomycetes sp. NU457]
MPLFSSKLPPYTGQYPVGVIDIEAPCDKRTISDITLKADGKSAFELDTVLFSLYYPTEEGAKSTKSKHYWIPPPLALTAEGYARFAKINNFFTNHIFTFALWGLAGSTRIPAMVDVPLRAQKHSSGQLSSESSSESSSDYHDKPGKGYPVIVFSHGMASSRTDYTQYCAELAARGYIVAAIEHRDGSGPGSVVMAKGQADRNVFHRDIKELQSAKELDTPALKKAQLDFRQAEIEETVRVLREINAGSGDMVFKNNPRAEGSDLDQWRGRLNVDDMTVGGHSYGATGALQVLRGGPSHALPFKGAIILDPGKSSGPLNDDVRVPILIVHSNSWSRKHSIFYGQPHFEVVRELAQNVLKRGHAAWFATSLGTSHPSVTDAPLIEPTLLSWTTGAKINVREGVEQYVRVSNQFLIFQTTGQKTGLLKMPITHPQYRDDEKGAKLKKCMPEEYRKYWQVHMAPQ